MTMNLKIYHRVKNGSMITMAHLIISINIQFAFPFCLYILSALYIFCNSTIKIINSILVEEIGHGTTEFNWCIGSKENMQFGKLSGMVGTITFIGIK